MKALEQRLNDHKIKPTAMRLIVLDFLTSQSAAKSLTDMEVHMDRTDRVTLYRTIKTFEENGLVHRIDDGSGVTKFALCETGCESGQHHDTHVHFFCNDCLETFCLPKINVPYVSLPDNFVNEEMNLTIKGKCRNCK